LRAVYSQDRCAMLRERIWPTRGRDLASKHAIEIRSVRHRTDAYRT
jgi:hypothetical protein